MISLPTSTDLNAPIKILQNIFGDKAQLGGCPRKTHFALWITVTGKVEAAHAFDDQPLRLPLRVYDRRMPADIRTDLLPGYLQKHLPDLERFFGGSASLTHPQSQNSPLTAKTILDHLLSIFETGVPRIQMVACKDLFSLEIVSHLLTLDWPAQVVDFVSSLVGGTGLYVVGSRWCYTDHLAALQYAFEIYNTGLETQYGFHL